MTSTTPSGPASSGPTESATGDSAKVQACALGANVVKARVPGVTSEQSGDDLAQNKNDHCTWTGGSSNQLLDVSAGGPEQYEPMEEVQKRLGDNSGAKFRRMPEFGPDAWSYEVSKTVTLQFKTAGLSVRIDGTQLEEPDFLAIARAIYTDAAKIT